MDDNFMPGFIVGIMIGIFTGTSCERATSYITPKEIYICTDLCSENLGVRQIQPDWGKCSCENGAAFNMADHKD